MSPLQSSAPFGLQIYSKIVSDWWEGEGEEEEIEQKKQ